MENQHRKITGYRELDQGEINAINDIKLTGIAIEQLVDHISLLDNVHHRWMAIGVTDLQKGLMALVRSVAKPNSF